jgi:hypothetical protein
MTLDAIDPVVMACDRQILGAHLLYQLVLVVDLVVHVEIAIEAADDQAGAVARKIARKQTVPLLLVFIDFFHQLRGAEM